MALAKGLTDMKIIMKQEKRPCTVWVNAETTINGLWHLFGWGKALIELEDGMLRGCDVWNVIYIVPLTKELQQKIEDEKMVRKCKALLDRAKRKVSTDNAKRIIEFLTNEILG